MTKEHLFHIDTALLTAHLVVRRFREDDGDSLFTFTSRNEQALTLYLPHKTGDVRTPAEAEMLGRRYLAEWLTGDHFNFGVWENRSASLIGLLSLDVNWDLPSARLTCIMDKDHTEKGYATESMQTVLRFGFSQLQLHKIYMYVSMDNYPAQRLGRKCGFRREGELREGYRTPSGTLTDWLILGMAKTDLLL